MASYWDVGMKVPFVADEDLSNACAQWKLVSPASTGGYVIATKSTCDGIALGVLQNSPCAGQAAEVVILGPTKARCRYAGGCLLKNGKFLKAASDGYLEPLDSTTADFPLARYFDADFSTTDASVVANVVFLSISSCGMQLGTS